MTQVSGKLTKITPRKITMNTTMKPHQTQKIITKTTHQIQKMKVKRETNNLTHHHQPLIVIYSHEKQTIHDSTTSSDPTEIKHQQASTLEHPHVSPKHIKPNMHIRYMISENDP